MKINMRYLRFRLLGRNLLTAALFSLWLINSPTSAGWQTETVDSEGNVGEFSSLAFDASGNPAMSYYDGGNNDLKFAHFNGDSWDITTVDSEGFVGAYTSLAFDPSGNPAISYPDSTNNDLKYAHFNDAIWDITTVDSEGNVGSFTSLAFDPSGNPAISYFDWTDKDLKYARFNGSIWGITTVDSEGNVTSGTSLAFDTSGNPAISYNDGSNGDLKYAHFNGDSWVITTVDSEGDVGLDTSLAFDASGNPAISYLDWTNGDLKYAHFNGDSWVITTVDSEEEGVKTGFYTSLAFDASGNPAISYAIAYPTGIFTKDFNLRYAHFNGASWDITTVDFGGNVGLHTSLAFDASGNPAISYRDWTNGSLKYAHFVPVTTTTSTTTTTTTTSTTTTTTTTTFVCRCPARTNGCISGTVTKADIEEPLAGKTVILNRVSPRRPIVRKKVVTDDERCYRFNNLEDGTYKIKVRKCEGGGIKIVVVAGGGKINNVNFECR